MPKKQSVFCLDKIAQSLAFVVYILSTLFIKKVHILNCVNVICIYYEKGGICMNIRKFWRLSCLSVASLFWASCGTDSNPQFPVAQAANPDSSADANSADSSSDAALTESSSSSATDIESSSSEMPEMSSSNIESSSSATYSSSSNAVKYILARDSSVICYANSYMGMTSCSSTKNVSCEDYKKYLGSDTTLSEKVISGWESALQSCGAIKDIFREELKAFPMVAAQCVCLWT